MQQPAAYATRPEIGTAVWERRESPPATGIGIAVAGGNIERRESTLVVVIIVSAFDVEPSQQASLVRLGCGVPRLQSSAASRVAIADEF